MTAILGQFISLVFILSCLFLTSFCYLSSSCFLIYAFWMGNIGCCLMWMWWAADELPSLSSIKLSKLVNWMLYLEKSKLRAWLKCGEIWHCKNIAKLRKETRVLERVQQCKESSKRDQPSGSPCSSTYVCSPVPFCLQSDLRGGSGQHRKMMTLLHT